MTQALKAKFDALREFVKTIPAEKLDMRIVIYGDCGCVLGHLELAGHPLDEDGSGGLRHSVLDGDLDELFSVSPSAYLIPTGQPAKDEFLRRLDLLEEKYCGGKQ